MSERHEIPIEGDQTELTRQYFGRWAHRMWRWCGVQIVKFPGDVFVYQEVLWKHRPDVLIETGTYRGGSAYFFATLMDLMGHGEVITIDRRARTDRPVHPRITYLTGGSTQYDIVEQVKARVAGKTVMVVLDSDHRALHVRRELKVYAPLVSVGQYLVIEDTFLCQTPIAQWKFGTGPAEARDWFLARHPEFEVTDRDTQAVVSMNPKGWLRKIRDA